MLWILEVGQMFRTPREDQVSNQQVQARSYTWYGADAATTVEMGQVTVEGPTCRRFPDPDSTGAHADHQAGPATRPTSARPAVAKGPGDPALLRSTRSRCSTAPDGGRRPRGPEVTFEYTEMLNGGVAPRAFSLADDGRPRARPPGANYVEGDVRRGRPRRRSGRGRS